MHVAHYAAAAALSAASFLRRAVGSQLDELRPILRIDSGIAVYYLFLDLFLIQSSALSIYLDAPGT